MVHLADYCMRKGGSKWDKTSEMRRALVEESRDERAKAKVAFALFLFDATPGVLMLAGAAIDIGGRDRLSLRGNVGRGVVEGP